MFNAFTTEQAYRQGISSVALLTARECCVLRVSRGIYVVCRVCSIHHELALFIDDDTALAERTEYRRLLGVRHTSAGVRGSDPAGMAETGLSRGELAARIRRREHRAAIVSHRHVRPGETMGGISAAMVHGIPLLTSATSFWGTRRPRKRGPGRATGYVSGGEPGDPVRVEFWSSRKARSTPWMVRRHGVIEPADVIEWENRAVTSAARTCADLGRLGSVADGVLAAEWFLTDGGAGLSEKAGQQRRRDLERTCEALAGRSGVARAQRALSVATGRTESPSEALALCCFDLLGVGEVQSQVEIADADGTVFARVDFLLRGSDGTQVVVEVDGAEKYSGSANGRGNALFDEKKREDRIRGLGYRLVRLTWADLMRPERVRKLLRQAGVAC